MSKLQNLPSTPAPASSLNSWLQSSLSAAPLGDTDASGAPVSFGEKLFMRGPLTIVDARQQIQASCGLERTLEVNQIYQETLRVTCV
ncbi:unannotated protein [freshwater metagenome]|uniref:Unannotated protein n=1 Tax=freshwater metagenome TaxID=449393 RepID=A0A6J6BYH2_9ZZZZ